MKPITLILAACLGGLASGQPALASNGDDQQPSSSARQGTTVTVYPLLVQAPIFGAEINLPSLPAVPGGGGGGGESGEISGTTDIALNSAYEVGVEAVADRWLVEARALWTDLGASRDTPRINVDTTTYFAIARGGVRFAPGLYATGGFRAVHVKLDASLTVPVTGRVIAGTAKKNFVDPLVGLEVRAPIGRRVDLGGIFEGGGFGVGTDVDLSGEFRLDWHIASHFDVRVGYSYLYYKWTVADVQIGSFARSLVSRQTLHGPVIGFGIPF